MMLATPEIKYLRWSLIRLASALLIGASVGGASYYFIQAAEKQNRIAAGQRTDSQGKLARAAQEEKELRAQIGRFIALQERGHVGTENRLDWIEHLARISKERKLHDFQYEFAPQKPVDSLLIPGGGVAGNHRFLVSPQRVSMKLLHEGDLVAFLGDLRTSVKAYIVVRSCKLARLPASSANSANSASNGLAPQLAAECDLDWISLQESR